MSLLDRVDPHATHGSQRDGRIAERLDDHPSSEPDAPRRRRRRLLAPVAVVVIVLAAAAWAFYANVGTGRPAMDMTGRVTAGSAPFPVVVGAAERGGIAGGVVYTGSVAAFNEEDIYPRVTGRIVEMPVYPGDRVRGGQLVARLDDVELSSRVREAEAMAATAQANRAQMEADLTAARHGVVQMEKEQAMVEAELTYAQAVAARSERLVSSGAISRQEYENDRTMAASLEAKRDAARARLAQSRAMEASAQGKLEAADRMVAQAQAALRTATVIRDYVNIQAPSTGYVVKRLVAPGVLVQPGTPILKIAQIDRVRLQANVGEKDLASIKVGSAVNVTPAAAGQAPITARVTSVFPFVDPGARTGVVEAVVENGTRRFLPGQYVRMEFVTGERADAVRVPRGAVVRLGGKATVWIVEEDRARPREVTTGLENADAVEITRGLAGGESIVVKGYEGLYAGARVATVGGTPGAPAGVDRGASAPPASSSPAPAAPGQPNGGAHGTH